MINWLKRKKSILDDWNFEKLTDFEIIHNTDSVQYVNKDASRMIYFSVLKFSGSNIFSIDTYTGEPTILENDGGWQLKGAKKFENQILICVISVLKQDDLEWAKIFFDSIKSR